MELFRVRVEIISPIEMTSWHDDRTGVYLIHPFDFLFKYREGIPGDNDLDAYLRSIALELFQAVIERKIVMSLVDADMKIIDVFRRTLSSVVCREGDRWW